jgi:hypothetical protein
MIEFVLSRIRALMQASRDTYHVDPVVFLVIYLVSVPVFYYSLVRTIRALAKRQGNEAMRWSAVFLCAVVAPFLYDALVRPEPPLVGLRHRRGARRTGCGPMVTRCGASPPPARRVKNEGVRRRVKPRDSGRYSQWENTPKTARCR